MRVRLSVVQNLYEISFPAPKPEELPCLQVRPWVVDITHAVNLSNEMNTITYHGLFQGKSPSPEGQPGFIMMQSNIVFFR